MRRFSAAAAHFRGNYTKCPFCFMVRHHLIEGGTPMTRRRGGRTSLLVCGGRGATPKAKPPSQSANKTRGRPKTEAKSHGAQAEPKVARRGTPSRPRPRSVAQGERGRKPSARTEGVPKFSLLDFLVSTLFRQDC